MTYTNVSANIACFMAKAGIGKTELAQMVCMSRRTLYARLKSPKLFTLSEIEMISKALRINIRDLLFERQN